MNINDFLSMSFSDWIAIVGAVTGSASLLGLIYKIITEKPKLKIENITFYGHVDGYGADHLMIRFIVHNRGSKRTEISSINFMFQIDKKQYSPNLYKEFDPIELLPDTTTPLNFQFSPQQDIMFKDTRMVLNEKELQLVSDQGTTKKINNAKLLIIHTHGIKRIRIKKKTKELL